MATSSRIEGGNLFVRSVDVMLLMAAVDMPVGERRSFDVKSKIRKRAVEGKSGFWLVPSGQVLLLLI